MKGIEDIKNMIRFTFAADAFALGYHWTYNIEENKEQFKKTCLDMIDPLAVKFHPVRKKGDISPYGDQELILLKSLTPDREFHPDSFIDHWKEIWDNYDDWIDNATKSLLETGTASASSDISPIGRCAPLFLMKGLSQEKLFSTTEKYISLTHNNPEVIDLAKFFLKLTYDVFTGVRFSDSLKNSIDKFPSATKFINKGLALTEYSWEELIESGVDTSCGIEASGVLTVYLLIRYWGSVDEMFHANAVLDGDCTARASILAMITGAKYGVPSYGEKWFACLKRRNEIEETLHKFE